MLTAVVMIGAIVAVAIAVVLILAAMRPDIWTVERAMTMKAPPDRIFPLIADFRRWTEWSPWETRDPGMQRTFGGAPATVGQTYAWTGNKNVGAGSMTVTELHPPSKIGLNLDFLKPFEAHNTATFTLTPQDDGTLVTWTMQGPTPYMFKIMHLFMNVDKMVGNDFEAGLAKMKAAAERG